MRLSIPKGAVCLIISSILLCSCAGIKKTPGNSTVQADPTIAVNPAIPENSTSLANPIIHQAHHDLAAGDFQKALDAYQREYPDKTKNAEVLKGYLSAIEYVKAYGDKALEKGDFSLARSTYDLLLKNFLRFSHFDKLLSFDRNFLVARVRMSRALGVERQAQFYLLNGGFQKAMSVYRELSEQYPRDPQVWEGYNKVLESIKNSADQALQKKDLALAGSTYRLLLKRGPSGHPVGHPLSYSRETLTGKITHCRKVLFENALEQYRSGNLNQAILIWKSILTFDPENTEVRKAVEMASLQSRNLESTR